MADDTPTTTETPAADKPTPRRRGPARKTVSSPTTRKPRVARAAAAVTDAAASVPAKERVAPAVRPRSTSRAANRPATTRKPAEKAAPSTAAAKTPKRTAGRPRKAGKSTIARATDAVGGRTVAVAIGAIAAVGATAAAVLTLRGSSTRNLGTTKKPIDISGTGDKGKGHPTDVHGSAHQPDGADSSASFRAGIADENTIPTKG